MSVRPDVHRYGSVHVRNDRGVRALMEAGPDGIEYLAFGAGEDPLDADMVPGWWSED